MTQSQNPDQSSSSLAPSVADTLYTPGEVCELLRISSASVRRFIGNGKLKAVRIGKQFRVSEREIERVLGEGL